jgi:hypothetical protein
MRENKEHEDLDAKGQVGAGDKWEHGRETIHGQKVQDNAEKIVENISYLI